jgi:hypothetical protein
MLSPNTQTEFEVLSEFLNFALQRTDEIFEKFTGLQGAKMEIDPNNPLHQYCYIPGSRENRVLLIAHADTYWDENYFPDYHDVDPSNPDILRNHRIRFDSENHEFISEDEIVGLGADDRAGCAFLWLLRELGHSFLIVSGEEHGQQTSHWIMDTQPSLADEINQNHQFLVQLDRRNEANFKCYDVGTEEFREYVRLKTGYTEPDRSSVTDIKVLSRDICGVNLSVGYRNEHSPDETLNFEHWLNTYQICKTWLAEPNLPKYERR